MTTFDAPKALAEQLASKPTDPQPMMSTLEPQVTPVFLQACIDTDNGSIKAPSSNVKSAGNLFFKN